MCLDTSGYTDSVIIIGVTKRCADIQTSQYMYGSSLVASSVKLIMCKQHITAKTKLNTHTHTKVQVMCTTHSPSFYHNAAHIERERERDTHHAGGSIEARIGGVTLIHIFFTVGSIELRGAVT